MTEFYLYAHLCMGYTVGTQRIRIQTMHLLVFKMSNKPTHADSYSYLATSNLSHIHLDYNIASEAVCVFSLDKILRFNVFNVEAFVPARNIQLMYTCEYLYLPDMEFRHR